MSIVETILNLGYAVLLGAAIGFERQWRQRMAGLRTNTLVALGAASFVVFSALVGSPDSSSRIAAQIVSGVGFLGAGLIFREGLNVRGLNTAATLWCSAAVGTLAGAGHPREAAIVAGLVVLINLFLRSIVRFVNRQASHEGDHSYAIRVVCRSADEAHVRALLLQGLSRAQLSLRQLDSSDIENAGRVEVSAWLSATQRCDGELEQIVGRLSLEPSVSAARWRVEPLVE